MNKSVLAAAVVMVVGMVLVAIAQLSGGLRWGIAVGVLTIVVLIGVLVPALRRSPVRN